MAPPLARTNAEAHIYMELTPCTACGETEFTPQHDVIMADGDLASRYAGPCPRCDTAREFVFRIPEQVILPDDEEPTFGDGQPSELIDAGQWVWLADLVSSGIPATPDEGMSAESRRQARLDLRTAAAAVAEALNFVVEGADAVPAEAVWTDAGRAVYQEEPGRFRRRRLEVVRDTYRELADRFSD